MDMMRKDHGKLDNSGKKTVTRELFHFYMVYKETNQKNKN